MDNKRLARLVEFFAVGVIMGVTEDLLVVAVATNEEITLQMIGIVVVVAIPFAGLSELVVDRADFEHFERLAAWLTTGSAERQRQ